MKKYLKIKVHSPSEKKNDSNLQPLFAYLYRFLGNKMNNKKSVSEFHCFLTGVFKLANFLPDLSICDRFCRINYIMGPEKGEETGASGE